MEKIKLSDLCNPAQGQIKEQPDTIIDYIDISSVDNESKTVTGYQTMTFAESPSRARKTVKKGNILVSTVRPNLNAVAVLEDDTPNKTVASTGFCILDCKETTDKRFVFNFCRSKAFIDEMVMQATGASYPAVSDKIVRAALVPAYPYDEQRKIGEVLDSISVIIENRKRELAELDNLIKARFVEMFGDTVLNPFGWDKDLLGIVCDVRDGTHDSPKYYETGFPLVTSKNVTGGKIDLKDCSLICEDDFKKINERSKVAIGDIIMPMIGTVGKPVIVDIEPNFAIKNVSLIKFKTASRVINIYIQALLQSDYFDDAVLSKVRGGTQKFISLGDIRKLEVLVPPIEKQKQFASFVSQVDKSKAAVQKALEEAQLLFDSLMQQYFG
ncbi:MAG: restriction endonuclease subunit S [Firmicutes bacterium]|nr:restriction endonuclease subunit S [Bacillota bacterium]